MSQTRKSTVIVMLVIAFIVCAYITSYGPAWSIAVRTGDRQILNAYKVLPQWLKKKSFDAWSKLDDKPRLATLHELPPN